MNEMDKLLKDIEILRENLYNLIKMRNENLLDQDVQTASKMMNASIVEYNKILEKKMGAQ